LKIGKQFCAQILAPATSEFAVDPFPKALDRRCGLGLAISKILILGSSPIEKNVGMFRVSGFALVWGGHDFEYAIALRIIRKRFH
jgi:hypothetical protein